VHRLRFHSKFRQESQYQISKSRKVDSEVQFDENHLFDLNEGILWKPTKAVSVSVAEWITINIVDLVIKQPLTFVASINEATAANKIVFLLNCYYGADFEIQASNSFHAVSFVRF
jgi:hypothetical protein